MIVAVAPLLASCSKNTHSTALADVCCSFCDCTPTSDMAYSVPLPRHPATVDAMTLDMVAVVCVDVVAAL
jgi:hypothetical protein